MNPWAFASFAASSTCSSLASRFPYLMFLPDADIKKLGRLKHVTQITPQHRKPQIPVILPIDKNPAGARFVESGR
jgi:hypothetical protein